MMIANYSSLAGDLQVWNFDIFQDHDVFFQNKFF